MPLEKRKETNKMFDPKLFNYDAETHTGTYNGKFVPSVSKLVNVAFPLSTNIPTEHLEKASVRGTNIHEMVEELNKCENYEEMKKLAYGTENQDLINYTRLLQTFKLRALKCEERVFLLDEDGELITYGHYDMILESLEDTPMLEKDECVMFDLKTVSEFEDEKVKLQTEIYRTAYQQMSLKDDRKAVLSRKTGGIHLRDGKAKIHLFAENCRNTQQIIAIAKKLREEYDRSL